MKAPRAGLLTRLGARLAPTWAVASIPVYSIVLAFAVAAIVVIVSSTFTETGFDPLLPIKAYSSLLAGAFFSGNGIVNTLVAAAPLMFGGLAVGIGLKAGLFNIGVAGQFLAGAFAAAVTGASLSTAPTIVGMPLAMLAGAAAGAAYGFIPGYLKARTGAHEVVTTIMLNNAAVLLLTWAVNDLVRAPGFSFPRTGEIGASALPILWGRNLHLGIVFAVVAIFLIRWILERTTLGFEIRTVGANPHAARYAGMRPIFITALTMTISGLLAGLAGAIQMLGVIGFYAPGITASVGFDSIAVALLGRSDPIGILFAALLFGAFRAGAPLMQIETSVPIEVIDIIQALVILFLAADLIVRRVFRARAPKVEITEMATVTGSWGSGDSAGGHGSLMDILALPRLIWEFLVYLLAVMPDLLPIILSLATPLALGALCGVLGERSGVVNIGIEGIMLMAAFFGYLTGFALHEPLGTGIALALGVLVAVATGAVLGLLHAWLTVSVRADQIIAGTMMNIAALGVTGYLNRLIITPSGRGGAGVIPPFHLPDQIASLPLIGPLLAMFLDQGPIAMSVIVLVLVSQFALFRTRWGLRMRAVGEHPKAADTVGIDVFRQRYMNVIIGCAIAGLAGAYLTLESTGSFQNGMTGGRGFIALAAVIFGRWTPVGAFLGALLFGTATAFGIIVNVRPADGELGTLMKSIPTFWYAALPYLITVVILAGVVGRSTPPAADGIPYAKEGKG